MNNFLKFLQMIRNTKIKIFIIILTSILIFIFTYKNQELWLIKNCTGLNSSPSCIYSWQRLYIIPSLVFFLFYIIIWVDKIFLCIKKIDLYLDNLESRRKFLLNAIITVFISITIFNLRFSFIPLNPFNINWLINNGGDLAIHYMGWFVFRESPWEFPLGIIKNLNYPIGTSVGYTDPIPLLAISLKFLASRVSEDFQYSGIWLFLCYVFQGFFSALILKNWDCKFIFKVFASLLIAITPVFLNRYGHLALDCHWVILASFCLYQSSNLSIKSKILLHSLLLLFAAWVHPYITLILFVLHFSLLISFVLERKYKIIKIIMNFILLAIIILISWYIIGYFYIGGSTGSSIGFFSTNLNAFFNPMDGNSQFLLKLTYWGGQYEGFAYLGLGLIMLFVVIIFENSQHKNLVFTKKNRALLLGLFILAFYAISNDIRLGGITLLKFPIPDLIMEILGIFQSSGRFIWPLYYFLIISLLYIWIMRKRNIYKKFIFLLLIFIIQFIDIYPMYRYKSVNIASGQKYISKIDISKWLNFFGDGKRKILFYPSYKTYFNSSGDYLDFWYLAAKYNYAVNFGYLARNNPKLERLNEDILLNEIKTGLFSKDTIYVTNLSNTILFDSAIKEKLVICQNIDNYFVCKKSS